MSATVQRTLVSLAVSVAASSTFAAPVDLSTWQALTLNFPGGQNAGNWALQPGNTTVTQTINADPSFFRNNVNQGSYKIEGTWRVASGTGDDDYMGFAFGYQNSSNFYLFDWKAGSQTYVGTTAAEGMAVKKFTGATGNGLTDLSLEEFWENEVDLGDMDVLATNHGTTKGWLANRDYTFKLDFNSTTAGAFRIQVLDGAVSLWDTTVVDNTFTNGQFAFFNNSQSSVTYAGFVQDDVKPPIPAIPEPETYALMLAGLVAVALAARRRRRD